MGLNRDRVRENIFESIPIQEGDKKRKIGYLRHIFEFGELDTTNAIGLLDDDNYELTELKEPHEIWRLSPSTNGSTSAPTLRLDYRWNNRLFFIDISSYSVIVQLPVITEILPGFKVKFILSEASEGEATKNFGIITDATGTDIQGYIDGGCAINVTANTSSVYWDTSDGAASGGDWCELITDGNGWFITGQAALANAVDIADGHDVTT